MVVATISCIDKIRQHNMAPNKKRLTNKKNPQEVSTEYVPDNLESTPSRITNTQELKTRKRARSLKLNTQGRASKRISLIDTVREQSSPDVNSDPAVEQPFVEEEDDSIMLQASHQQGKPFGMINNENTIAQPSPPNSGHVSAMTKVILEQLERISKDIKALQEKQQLDEETALQKQLLDLTMPNQTTKELNREPRSLTERPSQQFQYLSTICKMLPKFSGEKTENFEGWVMNTRLLLGNVHLSDKDKTTAVLLKIEGAARKIVENASSIITIEDILSALDATYGQDEMYFLADTKQKPDEPAKIFLARLKTNLNLLGFQDQKKTEQVLLDYFLTGLLPSLADRIKSICPYNLDHALKLAMRLESAQNSTRDARKLKRNFENLNQVSTETSNTELRNQINMLANEVKKFSESYRNSPTSNKKNSYNQRGNNEYRGTCFACQKVGHNYIRCPSASEDKKDEIKRNFNKYVSEYKAKRLHSSNSNGVSTNPQ